MKKTEFFSYPSFPPPHTFLKTVPHRLKPVLSGLAMLVPNTQKSACLCFPGAAIKDEHHLLSTFFVDVF